MLTPEILNDLFLKLGSNNPDFRTGVLIIAGGTSTQKTSFVAHIVNRWLQKLNGNSKPKTLLFLEDPPELAKAIRDTTFCFGNPPPAANLLEQKRILAREAFNKGYLYTSAGCYPLCQRYVGTNADGDLKDILRKSALRQTPGLVFIGEVRQPSDWRCLWEFAKTGHPIITTTHAGSLREVFAKLFESLKARTPLDRANVVEALFGVIHRQREKFDDCPDPEYPDRKTNLVLDSVWWSTPLSRSGLAQFGVTALVPGISGHCLSRSSKESLEAAITLGRQYFLAKGEASKSSIDIWSSKIEKKWEEYVRIRILRNELLFQ